MTSVLAATSPTVAYADECNTLVGQVAMSDGSSPAGVLGVVLGWGADINDAEPVAAFATDPDGSFTVTIDPGSDLVQQAKENANRLNLRIGLDKTIDTNGNPTDTVANVYRFVTDTKATVDAQASPSGAPGEPCLRVPSIDPWPAVARVLTDAEREAIGYAGDLSDPPVYTEGSLADGEAAVNVDGSIGQSAVVAWDPTGLTVPTFQAAEVVTHYSTDATNSVLTTKRQLAGKAELDGGGTDGRAYPCVMNGSELKKKGMHAYAPIPMEYNDEGMDLSYTWALYQSPYARTLISVGPTWQIESCHTGGAQTFRGWRLKRIGPGVTQEQAATSLLAGAWQSGRDLPLINVTMNVQVGGDDDPVQIGASASQAATGVNKGSRGTRGPDAHYRFDRFRNNAVIALWEEVWGYNTPVRNRGSRDYQAAIAQGLYEFPRSDPGPKSFYSRIYFGRRCTTWNYSCPT